MAEGYVVYGNELSLFTRKLEAALIFYGVDFERRAKTRENAPEIEQRAGTHQMPVLLTPENWALSDTTPILHLLDARFPRRAMFPAGPLGILVHAVEEYFDEWIARTMVHYRWHYPESAEFAAPRLAAGDPEIAAAVRAWGPRVCRATGTESEHQQREAEAEYRRLLEAMETQLGQTRYLLGDRPCAVDSAVLGGLRGHTWMDPDPKKVVRAFPRVVAWCEKEADRGAGDGELAPFPQSTPFAQTVLREMPDTYRPYALGNRDAQAAGDKAFTAEIYGEAVSYLSRPYPERSRRMLADRQRQQLSGAERARVGEWLGAVGLADCFAT